MENKILCDKNGIKIYEGECKKNIANGHGILYKNGIKIFEGYFINGIPNIEGVLYKNGKMIYKGGFLNGAFHGKGMYISDNMVYIGQYNNGNNVDGLLYCVSNST